MADFPRQSGRPGRQVKGQIYRQADIQTDNQTDTLAKRHIYTVLQAGTETGIQMIRQTSRQVKIHRQIDKQAGGDRATHRNIPSTAETATQGSRDRQSLRQRDRPAQPDIGTDKKRAKIRDRQTDREGLAQPDIPHERQAEE